MTQIDISRPNTDIANITFHQDGSNHMSAFFDRPFLDESDGIRYLLGVTHLSCPMQNIPLMSGTDLLDLFTIYRRNAGTDYTNANNITLSSATLPVGERHTAGADTFHCRAIPVNSVADFVVQLNSFCNVFQRTVYSFGINPATHGATAVAGDGTPTPVTAFGLDAVAPDQFKDAPRNSLLQFGLSASGVIVMNMSAMFCNHYFIVFSTVGKTLFGFSKDRFAPSLGAQIVDFGDTGLLTGDIIQPAFMSSAVKIYASKCLPQLIKKIISVHVETSIPVKKTLVCENSTESSTYDLCAYPISQEYTSEIDVSNGRVDDTHNLSFKTYAGQVVLQDKSKAPSYYLHVLDVRDLRNLQLRLYYKSRQFDPITGKWTIKTNQFPITDDTYWELGLRFVSIV
jgi:hypothetical protein